MSEFPIHDRGVQGGLTPSVALEGESGSAGSGSPSSSAASSDLRKRFADAILEWLEEQGYNDVDADAILRAIFDKVDSDAE